MKETVCIFLLFWAMATKVGGQIVFFDNDEAFDTQADRNVYFSDGTRVVGSRFVAQLYFGASGDSLSPVLGPSRSFRDIPQTDPLAGTWLGATRTLTGFSVGDFVTLQVRVWDGTVAGSYEDAAALNFLGTQHGMSATFTYQIPTAADPPSFFYIENFRAFTLVPEPSVIGLAILGCGALFVLTRRK